MRFEIISKIVGDKFNSVQNDHYDNMKTILKKDYSKNGTQAMQLSWIIHASANTLLWTVEELSNK